ncbi:MAG: hypothetical protein LLG16_06745 [Euryarchaeota archaeon]|nr:hypothetical protein [Euryarchaeota archaeon]
MSKRGIPIGIAVVGVLAFLGGLLWIVGGAAAVLAVKDDLLAMGVGVFSVFLGLAFLLFGLGCLKGRGWVWTLGVVLTIVGMVLSVFRWYQDDFSDSSMISTLISILIMLFIPIYLTTNKVKHWFDKL